MSHIRARIKHYIAADIVTKPLDLKLWVTNRAKEARRFAKEMQALDAGLAEIESDRYRESDAEGLLRTFTRNGGGPDVFINVRDLRYWIKRLAREDSYSQAALPRLAEALENYAKYGRDFIKYVVSAATDAAEDIARYEDEFRVLDGITERAFAAGAAEYGYKTTSDFDDTYRDTRTLFDAASKLRGLLAQTRGLFVEVKKQGDELQRRASTYDADKYRPLHGEVETLYHATAFAPEIARNGFDRKIPDDEVRYGIGAFGAAKAISFTTKKAEAVQIARALKDVWMIAHGKLTDRDLFKWMEAERIDIEKAKREAGYRRQDYVDGRRPNDWRLVTLNLYNQYLWHSKLRYNPVLVNRDRLLYIMDKRRLTDIGVLECEVRLTGQEEYKDGMNEFRVPPEQVISVKRVA